MANLTKTYTLQVEGEQAMKGVTALRAEFKQLDKELENVEKGSAEAAAIIKRMGEIKGDIKGLNEEIRNLDPGEKINAFINLSSAATGAFGIATVAAKNFGLGSAENIGKLEEKLLSVITVLQSLEAIRAATESQHLTAIKNMLGLGNAYTLAGVKAKLFGTTTRAALTATGIGVLLVAVGTLISNWAWVTKQVTYLKNKFADTFPAIGKFIDFVTDKARDLASILTFGLIDNAATAAAARLEEAENKITEQRIANRKRLIAEEAAAGRSTYKLKQDQLHDELKLLEENTEEWKDKWSEIRALKAAHDKSLAERDKKAWDDYLAEEKKRREEAEKLAEEAYNKRRAKEKENDEKFFGDRAEARERRLEHGKQSGKKEQELLQIEVDNLVEQQADLQLQGKRYSLEWEKLETQRVEKLRTINAAYKAEREKEAADIKVRQDKDLADLEEATDIAVINLKLRGATDKEVN